MLIVISTLEIHYGSLFILSLKSVFIELRERERERSVYQCEREALIGYFSYVPRPGIEQAIK